MPRGRESSEAGDSARRRIERDLHDGAQQRLLTLSYELRLALSRAEADGSADLAASLTRTGEQVRMALAELRELAHGIYPAILTESGLGPALRTLADGAPLPVEIDAVDRERYPPALETAVYLAVDEAVADATTRGATHAEVRIMRGPGRLVTEVVDDGTPRSRAPLGAEDRIGALGGSLVVDTTLLRAEIPCA